MRSNSKNSGENPSFRLICLAGVICVIHDISWNYEIAGRPPACCPQAHCLLAKLGRGWAIGRVFAQAPKQRSSNSPGNSRPSLSEGRPGPALCSIT